MATTKQDHGTPFSATSSGTVQVVATAPAVANQTFYVTDISGSASSSNFGTLTVYNGVTALWTAIPGDGAYEHAFVQPLPCSNGATCTVVMSGTFQVAASLAGFYLNNT